MNMQPKRYRAFISYSRHDAKVARKLHSRLEHYRIPKGLETKADSKRRLGRFFKDDEDLAASEKLGLSLNAAIDDSEALIVIASPEAATSQWVNAEVEHVSKQPGRRILAIIARGKPFSTMSDDECFPPALRRNSDPSTAPLAANIQADGFSRAFIRIVAALLEVPFDTLWNRERRRRIRKWTVYSLSAVVALFVSVMQLARAINARDALALRAHSVQLSAENWRFYKDEINFDSAYRAALASTRLDEPPCDLKWNLNTQIESSWSAVAFSGRALPRRRIVISPFPNGPRNNFRDDIPDANPAQRVAVYAEDCGRSMGFSSNGERLALTTAKGRVLVADVKTGRVIYSHVLNEVGVGAQIALDATGRQAMIVGSVAASLIDVEESSTKEIRPTRFGACWEIGVIDSRWRIAGTVNGQNMYCNFDAVTGIPDNAVEIEGVTTYSCNTIGGLPFQFAAFHGENATPEIALVTTNWLKRTIQKEKIGDGVGQVKAIAMDDKCRWIALGGNGSGGGSRAGVQIVSTDGEEVTRLVGHTGEIYALAFISQLGLVASAGSDFSVRIWDPEDGRELIRLSGHCSDVYVAKVSPDGHTLATCSADGSVLLWDLSLLYEIEASQQWRLPTEAAGELPASKIPIVERNSLSAYSGRPWDISAWKDDLSPQGIAQSFRLVLVRTFGLSQLDFE